MEEVLIPIPARADIKSMDDVLELVDLDKGRNGCKRAVFDFRKCSYIVPSACAVLVAYRDYLKDRGVETLAMLPARSRVSEFLVSLGVLKPQRGDLDDAYVRAMSDYAVPVRACRNHDECTATQQLIMKRVQDRLRPQPDVQTLASIDYMIGEIWDNAGVHGYGCYETLEYPMPVYISAFSYKTHLEVAVLDRGRGIHTTLRNNPKFATTTAKQALREVLKESVSGHPRSSPGFGLFSASEFIRANQGSLYIWSSSRRLELKEGRETVRRCKYEHGTLVTFIIDAQQPIPFERIVKTQSATDWVNIFIREEGDS